MALTTRGKAILAALGVMALVGGAVVGYLLLTGKKPLDFIGGGGPPTCPLTGLAAPGGEVPSRPAVAVKVENLDVARPQAGLDKADVVYEQPVEGGITRFVAVFQCQDAGRIGPVRSGRLVDPDILIQFGDATVFGYAGAVQPVVEAIRSAGITDVSINAEPNAYHTDPNRAAPHNTYTSTKALYRAAGNPRGDIPEEIFEFEDQALATGPKAKTIHLEGGSGFWQQDVMWRYARRDGTYERSHGTEPHTLESGRRVKADTVVVQIVDVRRSAIIDAAGNPSPEVRAIGKGKVLIFRDGRVEKGRWVRSSPGDVTEFVDTQGNPIPLAPGHTWIELYPKDADLSF